MLMRSEGSMMRVYDWSLCCPGPLLSLTVLLVHACVLTEAMSWEGDVHGGVQMGVSNRHCDDAKTNLSVDWDPRIPGADIEYRCRDNHRWSVTQNPARAYCQTTAAEPLHKCMYEPIYYPDTPPLSGAHRPLWPVYGEYVYLPPQRWLHSLEHGAVVLLYHPCADQDELSSLKSVVRSCLHRHIITPYRYLPTTAPFALLTWKCKLTMSYVDKPLAEKFIKDHAILPAPEGSVYKDGQYDLELVRPAQTVSDIQDSLVCPQSTVQNFKYRSKTNDLSGGMMEKILSNIYWNGGGGR